MSHVQNSRLRRDKVGHGNAWYVPACTNAARKDGQPGCACPSDRAYCVQDGPLMAPAAGPQRAPQPPPAPPGPSAPRRAAMTAGAQPCFALHNTHPRFGASLLKAHSHNCIKLQNICTLTPAQTRARHPTAAAASVLLATPNARSRRPRKLQTCTNADR